MLSNLGKQEPKYDFEQIKNRLLTKLPSQNVQQGTSLQFLELNPEDSKEDLEFVARLVSYGDKIELVGAEPMKIFQ